MKADSLPHFFFPHKKAVAALARKYIPVRFLRPFAQYNEKDVASFEVDRSNALVKAGVAEHYEEQPSDKPAPRKRKPRTKKSEPVVCQESSADNPF